MRIEDIPDNRYSLASETRTSWQGIDLLEKFVLVLKWRLRATFYLKCGVRLDGSKPQRVEIR